MLPSNLFCAKILKGGRLVPKYLPLHDEKSLALALEIITIFEESVGEKKRSLYQKLEELETQYQGEYKVVRGLAAILERRCKFEVKSRLEPSSTRSIVFEEASRRRVAAIQDRNRLLLELSTKMGVSQHELEESLFSDLDEEQIISSFEGKVSPELLVNQYNLSLAQTALFKSSSVEFNMVGGNWRRVFRDIKRLGLMYSVEAAKDNGESDKNSGYSNDGDGSSSNDDNNDRGEDKDSRSYLIRIDGPLSLFKMTDRYGTLLAKLLPSIVSSSDDWSFRAELIDRHRKNRILHFEEKSSTAPFSSIVFEKEEEKEEEADAEEYKEREKQGPSVSRATSPLSSSSFSSSPHTFDSSVERKFASSFRSLQSGWVLKREPEPLVAGRHVLIPDFSLEKYGMKVYFEIVGFWTREYLERKLSKLASLGKKTQIIVAVNETLRCSDSAKLSRLRESLGYSSSSSSSSSSSLLFTYSKEVPLQPVVSYLKELEEKYEQREMERLRREGFPELGSDASAIEATAAGGIVNLEKLAASRNAPLSVIRKILCSNPPSGYRIVGDHLIRESKLEELQSKLRSHGEMTLGEAVKIIESIGFGINPQALLQSLGFTIEWEGLDFDKSRVRISPETSP